MGFNFNRYADAANNQREKRNDIANPIKLLTIGNELTIQNSNGLTQRKALG